MKKLLPLEAGVDLQSAPKCFVILTQLNRVI